MFFFRSRKKQTPKSLPASNSRKSRRQGLPLLLEVLEDRTLMTAMPQTLADPSLYGVSGLGRLVAAVH